MNKMKNSGIDYLGFIPIEWKIKRFKFCVQICNGGEYADIVVDDGGYPVMGSGGEFARASRYMYDKESVLLGRKGTIDKPLIVNEPFWCVDTMFYTKTKVDMNIKFIYYCALNFRFDYYVTSTALPSMTQKDLGSELLAVPSLQEQQAIATFLDDKCLKIDNIINDLEKEIEILEKYKKSLIAETVTKGLDKNVPMKDSGVDWIGAMPEHWEVKRLKHLTSKIGSGKTPLGGSEIYEDIGIMFIRSQNVYDVGLYNEDVKYINERTHKEMRSSTVKQNDVLLNITGASIGRSCLYTLPTEANVNQHVCIIRLNSVISSSYVRYVIISDIGKIQVSINQMGGNRDSLTFEQIGNFNVPLPQNKEQQEIVDFLDKKCIEIDSTILAKEKQLETIRKYKQSLIYEYVTGKKRVVGFGGERDGN